MTPNSAPPAAAHPHRLTIGQHVATAPGGPSDPAVTGTITAIRWESDCSRTVTVTDADGTEHSVPAAFVAPHHAGDDVHPAGMFEHCWEEEVDTRMRLAAICSLTDATPAQALAVLHTARHSYDVTWSDNGRATLTPVTYTTPGGAGTVTTWEIDRIWENDGDRGTGLWNVLTDEDDAREALEEVPIRWGSSDGDQDARIEAECGHPCTDRLCDCPCGCGLDEDEDDL